MGGEGELNQDCEDMETETVAKVLCAQHCTTLIHTLLLRWCLDTPF